MKKLVYLSAIVFLYGCPKEKVSPTVNLSKTELLTSTSWKLYAFSETKNGIEKTQNIQDCMKDDVLTFYKDNTWKLISTIECDTLPNYSKPYTWFFDQKETEISLIYKTTIDNALKYDTSTFKLYELTKDKFIIGSKNDSIDVGFMSKLYLTPIK
jgi:hypothetical protein